ncbi:hypothetical protein FQA39_LY02344 [Lamprigera yunnana]|nr:hypothetical protein FQA39_LY02344 [Lamprigera yunnana]
MARLWIVLLLLAAVGGTNALDNGLALTPPMGWLSWQRFRCVTDCELYPDECISDKLLREMADVMSSEGYLEAGYEYIIIDDCWLEWERDENDRLQPDRVRFPHGMKNLADYIHSKGLKFGIYQDVGTNTCAGYPGLKGHLEIDANTFAEWEIDYIKVDGCYASHDDLNTIYPEFGSYLKKLDRPILYSCEWPLYLGFENTNYALVAEHCNMWRSSYDIQDSLNSLNGIIDWHSERQDTLITTAGRGQWNDPDMLLVGNYGLSYDQSEAQMAVWAIMASPLLMSVDLRTIKPVFKDLLLHKEVIAVNQDELGIQGKLVNKISDIHVWVKPITPIINDVHSYAIAYQSRREDGYRVVAKVSLKELGLSTSKYNLRQIFDSSFDEQIVQWDEQFILTNAFSLKRQDSIVVVIMKKLSVALLLLVIVRDINTLDNGLALTPPMGWLSWQRFRCLTDCELYPDECISDKLIRRTADLMSSEGYLEAGYEYIIIDDCWLEKERDESGRLQPDRVRFPHGMKNLADYIHSKGLKFGIYEDVGTNTCAGYPGLKDHLEIDANTFAEWEIDYIKVDGCYASDDDLNTIYPEFGKYLKQTNRPIVYSCEWPLYLGIIRSNYTLIAEHCNLWRSSYDINDSYGSLNNIVNWHNIFQNLLIESAGKGGWNDPDMLLVGNYGLSYDQSKTQMALWAIMASPLLMSVDLKTIRPEFKELLLHKGTIAVNQDELAIQGRLVKIVSGIYIFTRPITPVVNGENSYAIAFHNRKEDGYRFALKISLKKVGLLNRQYRVTDILDDIFEEMLVSSDDEFIVRVNPSGVVFLKAIPE